MRLGLLGLLVWAAHAQVRFVEDLYPILTKAGCRNCHQVEGVASTTRLQFPESDQADEVQAFGESLRRFMDAGAPADSLLFKKPTNRVPHAGGRRIEQGTPEEQKLLAWIRETVARAPEQVPVARRAIQGERRVLRRLTHSQYDNTVRDLLGDSTGPSRHFPQEDFIDGFKNQDDGQGITPLLAEAYSAAAEKLAARYIPPPCKTGDCTGSFVREFGRRAFRRPLSTEEAKRYAKLAAAARGFEDGARLVVEGMLQSPSFLYRLESSDDPDERRWAKASRLSYLLWDTMPDEPLFREAEAGALDSADGMVRTARRMLADPKARQALDEYIAQWMRFDRVLTMVKERSSYPAFTRELAVAMTEETRRFIADLVWNERNFMEFYTARHTFVNADLAAVYKVVPPAEEFGRVNYPEDSARAGILSQATFLALTSKPSETSPTARGLFVREQFLCQHVPPPPPGASASLPPQRADRPMTNKERLAVHLSNPSCAGCHTLIDPIGFGLENYDAIGAHRAKAAVTIFPEDRKEERKKIELELDVNGYVAGIKDSDFRTPRELGEVLARTPQCQDCIAKQYFRYALGHKETQADREILERIFADFRQSGFKFQTLMVSVLRWTEFPPPAS